MNAAIGTAIVLTPWMEELAAFSAAGLSLGALFDRDGNRVGLSLLD